MKTLPWSQVTNSPNRLAYVNASAVARTTSFIRVAVGLVAALSISACTPKAPGWTDYLDLAQKAYKDGDYATAELNYSKAATICEKQFGKDDGRRANCLGYLAEMLKDEQQWGKAAEVYKDLLPILEKLEAGSKDLKDKQAEYAEIQSKLKEYGIGPDGAKLKSDDPNADKPKAHNKKSHKKAH